MDLTKVLGLGGESFEWLLLLLRWLHIVTGVSWIGASIFFMWLDRSFEPDPSALSDPKRKGHVGHLWMVHGGGFYHVEKMLMGSVEVPKDLHWFKWESYWTWMSGMALLLLIFYTSGGTFLLDSSVSTLSFLQASVLGLGSLLISWFCYDWLWESSLTKRQPLVGHALTLLWFAAVSYIFCHTLSGRAAYIHSGALLGTWMTANVFLRIIPRQVKMVEAAKRGEPVNSEWGKNAKSRSTHNTYFTLPVIFIMLSNHFPMTYGNTNAWGILLVISAAGAAIRESFVSRVRQPKRARGFALLGSLLLLFVVIFSKENAAQQPLTGAEPVKHDAIREKGMVVGEVYFDGEIPEPKLLNLPSGCQNSDASPTYSDEVKVTGGKLQNVLIRVVKGLSKELLENQPIPTEPVVVDQKGCIYIPRTVGVRVGQKVEFVNSDPIFHNVRSVSKAADSNEGFNVAMPQKNERFYRIFNKPELVLQTKCSVHPWMAANIAVVEHPYFAVTDSQGHFSLPNLPAGQFEIEFWHETLGTQLVQYTVTAEDAQSNRFAPLVVHFKLNNEGHSH